MKTKIIFMGTPQFSVPILEGLLANENYDVLGVVTQPDRPVGRKKVLTPTPVKEAAVKHQLKIWQPEKISGSEEMTEIMNLEPDILITAAFGQFLPEKLLHSAKIRALNVHASLLPKYRGGAPIHYAVMNGEEKTGVTIMEMVKKMDAGGIFSQKEIPITEHDTTGMMFEKLSFLGRDLLLETLPDIIAGQEPTPQNEEEVTFSPNIKKEEEKLDFTKTAKEVRQKIYGLNPFPGAFGLLEGNERIKIWDAFVTNEATSAEPGTVIATNKRFQVACGENSVLEITNLQPAGKKAMTSEQYLNGSGKSLMIGMSFV